MVKLFLIATKGNSGGRYFPSYGYLGLTPVRVEGGQSLSPLLPPNIVHTLPSHSHKDRGGRKDPPCKVTDSRSQMLRVSPREDRRSPLTPPRRLRQSPMAQTRHTRLC